MYFALSGLIYLSVSVTQGDALGYYIAPLWGFYEISKRLLRMNLRRRKLNLRRLGLNLRRRKLNLRRLRFILRGLKLNISV
jgi:hypothetical protein